MNHQHNKHLPILWIALAVTSLLSACGKPSIDCPDGQVAINDVCTAATCQGDDECPQNFKCDNGTCAPRAKCDATNAKACGRGTCDPDSGACTNPEWCTFSDDCIDGYVCDMTTRQCTVAPCENNCKDGGVCNEETRQCENPKQCDDTTDAFRCLPESQCINKKCVTHEEFCKKGCRKEGGVCHDTDFRCINKTGCTQDSECLKGNFCEKTSGLCLENKCATNNKKCTGGGVCNPATGHCGNPQTCTIDKHCLPGHSCVAKSKDESPSCVNGEDPCEGACVYGEHTTCKALLDGNKRVAGCYQKADGECDNMFDCLPSGTTPVCRPSTDPALAGALRCQGIDESDGSTLKTCKGKDNKKNRVNKNSEGALLLKLDEVSGADISCDTEPIYYKINKADLLAKMPTTGTGTGEIFVRLAIKGEEVGGAGLSLRLYAKNGEKEEDVGKSVSYALPSSNFKPSPEDARKSSVTFLHKMTKEEVEALPGNELYVEIFVTEPRDYVTYTLLAGVREKGAVEVCQETLELPINVAQKNGNLDSVLSTTKTLNICGTDAGGELKEQIWRFSVREPSYVQVNASVPIDSPLDLVLQVRKGDCTRDDADVLVGDTTCTNNNGKSLGESMAFFAEEPGDYYLVVTNKDEYTPAEGKDGKYQLYVKTEKLDKDCLTKELAAKATCKEEKGTFYTTNCSADRTKRDKNECSGKVLQSEGVEVDNKCDPNSGPGVCLSDLGSKCEWAIPVDLTTTSSFKSGWRDLSTWGNNFTGFQCNSDSLEQFHFAGSDIVYKVKVGPKKGLEATTASQQDSTKGSFAKVSPGIYILDIGKDPVTSEAKCNDRSAQTCLAGAGATSSTDPATVRWYNDSDEVKEVYVVADSSPVTGLGIGLGGPSYTSVETKKSIRVQLEQIAMECQPGTKRCEFADDSSKADGKKGDIQQCSSSGHYELFERCPESSCQGSGTPSCAELQPGDICENAVDIKLNSKGVEQEIGTYDIAYVKDRLLPPGVCNNTLGSRYEYPGGKEYVFKFKGDAGDVFTFEVEPQSSSYKYNPMVWIADSCERFNETFSAKCTMGVDKESRGRKETISFEIPAGKENQDYYLIVESRPAGGSDGSFTLKATQVGVSENRCKNKRNSFIGCNTAKNALEYCDDQGGLQQKDCGTDKCNGGSKAETCDVGVQEGTCHAPHVLDLDGTGTNLLSIKGPFTSNNFGENDACGIPAWETRGNDSVVAITLKAGEGITITGTDYTGLNDNLADWSMYLLKKCLDKDTCVPPIDSKRHKVSYFSETGETVYLVLDMQSGSNYYSLRSDFRIELAWEHLKDVTCEPGKVSCHENKVVTCSADGKTKTEKECLAPSVCDQGECVIDRTVGDTCGKNEDGEEQALDVGEGASLTWTVNKGDKVDPKEKEKPFEASCIAPYIAAYSVFKVDVQDAGDLIRVKAKRDEARNGTAFAAMIFTDCADPSATCLASDSRIYDSGTWGKDLEIEYVAEKTGTHYIFLGTTSSSYNNEEKHFIDIELLPHKCDPLTDAPKCEENGGKHSVKYCRNNRWAEVSCSSGCMDGVCTDRTGNTCFDAIALSSPDNKGTLSGQKITSGEASNFSYLPRTGFSRHINNETDTHPGVVGSCLFSKNIEGVEKYYAVQLSEGDRLDLKVEGTSSAVIYILDDCQTQNCVEAFIPKKNGVSSLSYVARKSGTHYVVVDHAALGSSSESSSNVTLEWEVIKKADQPAYRCLPFSSTCKDGTLTVCDAKGQVSIEGTCSEGCDNGGCKLTPELMKEISACNTAPTISSSQLYTIPMQQLGSRQSDGGVCVGTSQKTIGTEAYFNVSLKKDQLFRIYNRSSRDSGSKGGNVAFARLVSCSEETYEPNKCVDGRFQAASKNDFEKLYEYKATKDESFPIVLDSFRVDSNHIHYSQPRQFYFEVITPECDPATAATTCIAADKGIMKYCSADGLWVHDTCTSGTCDASKHICTKPTASSSTPAVPYGDTCLEAKWVEFTGDSATTMTDETLEGFNNKYDLPEGHTCYKEGSAPTKAADVVYAVDVPADKKLKVSVTPKDKAKDLAVYLTRGCSALPNACLKNAGADKHGPVKDPAAAGPETEIAEYSNTSGETERVYVIIDSFYEESKAAFEAKFALVEL